MVETPKRVSVSLQKRRTGQPADAPPSGTDGELAEFQRATPELFLSMENALKSLADRDLRAARVAELRIFGSLPMAAVASIVGSSEEAAARDWTFAKSFMQRYIRERGIMT